MSVLGIIVIVIAAAGAFFGWRKGLIAQIGKLIGLCMAVMACRMFAQDVARWLVEANTDVGDSADTTLIWTFVAYLIIFLAVYIGVTLLGSGIKKVVHAIATPLIDRICGALFRMFLYMIAVSLALNVWLVIFPDSTLRRDPVVCHRLVLTDVSVLSIAPTVIGFCTAPGMVDHIWPAENHNHTAYVTLIDAKR